MSLFRRRPQYTDADAKVVGFFFEQYIELMKHGKDSTDDAMKKYVLDILQDLGIPEGIEVEEEQPEVQDEYPIIVRR